MDDFGYTSSDREEYNVIQKYLHDGEEILWVGRPCASAKPKPQGFLIVFALIWCCFALFWTVMASALGGIMGLFGLPFICVGIWLIYSSTGGLKKRYRNTFYAVTDSRCIIVYRSRRGENLSEFRFERMSNISLTDVKGNVGTIHFQQIIAVDNYYQDGRYSYRSTRAGVADMSGTAFVMIDNVHAVYRLISERVSAE